MKNQTYEEFYLKYRKISKAYAYGILHDWNMADDVSQDVLFPDMSLSVQKIFRKFWKFGDLLMRKK